MFSLYKLSILLITLIAVTSNAVSIPHLNIRDSDSRKLTLEDGSIICSFLPRDYGGNIGNSEDTAVAFCNQASSKAPDVRIFPSNFINTFHFATGDGYIQVTGTINRDAYGLDPNDGGGQYDNRAPDGAVCVGYKKFVNLIEPDTQLFCIRCCNDTSKCDTGHSTYGCKKVIPGDYS